MGEFRISISLEMKNLLELVNIFVTQFGLSKCDVEDPRFIFLVSNKNLQIPPIEVCADREKNNGDVHLNAIITVWGRASHQQTNLIRIHEYFTYFYYRKN